MFVVIWSRHSNTERSAGTIPMYSKDIYCSRNVKFGMKTSFRKGKDIILGTGWIIYFMSHGSRERAQCAMQ